MTFHLWSVFRVSIVFLLFGNGIICKKMPQTVTSTAREAPAISTISALGVLRQAESYAHEEPPNELCDMGGSVGLCQKMLADVGGITTAPAASPAVIASHLLPGQSCPNGTASLGGRVLTLVGVDALGRTFQTDSLVMRWADGIVPYNPVYWSGYGMQLPAPDCNSGTSSTPMNTP